METAGSILTYAAAAAALICFIIVLVRMFQHGHAILAIVCAVLAFACGIGTFITYIFGWMKSKEWNLSTIMLIWTVAWVLLLVGGFMGPSPSSYYQK
ncbi:MAG TPA: hypothetical protein VH643_22900 [Gemmataceae bacterium]|jgi:hypothetical protein